VIPQSLVVTGVSMPSERDYIGGGGFGRVFGGELQGRAVALKVLYKPNNNVVSRSRGFRNIVVDCYSVRPFVGRR